jgi:AmiR/NasT family two-component response regulator
MESIDANRRPSDGRQVADSRFSSAATSALEGEVCRLREQVENLQRALESRDMIGQAKGILMATAGCSAEAAFDLLRQQSQHQNIKIVELAAEVVAHHVRRSARTPDGA